MKKIFLLTLLICCSTMLFGQAWLRKLPATKTKTELNFFDYQKAFNDYWAPFNVVKGYYFENGIKKKAIGWKQFKRWEYDMESKINPVTGEFPKKTAQQVYEEYKSMPSQKLLQTTASWISLGASSSDGGYNGIGRISCIAFHPTDNNIYWVGAATGGLWQTLNNGSTWTCLTNNIGVLAVSDIIIPSDYAVSNTIYIATGDRDAWDNNSVGVLKSTDAGVTWTTTGLSYTLASTSMVSRLLLDPNNNQILIAATSNGVFKTINGGTTWNTQLSTIDFIDMEYKPGDFNTLYGCTYANGNSKIYVTANGGTSWTQAFTNAAAYRIELAVSAAQPTWVYALIEQADDGLYGIYKSTTSGTAYTQVFAGTTKNLLGWQADGADAGGQGFYDLTIAASPSNASTVLVGGVNTWRSTTAGTAWSIVNHWTGSTVQAVHADKHMLKYRADGTLFETNDGGVYVSTNNGTSWTDKTNGMAISQMYKLGVSQTVATEVITGLQDNGTKLLSAGVWTDAVGGDGMECLIDYTNVNVQYNTFPQGQMSRTTDHWANNTDITPASAGTGAWVTPFIVDPSNSQTIYAGYANVWKTTNRGTSWTKISTMNSTEYIRSMAIAASNTQYIYAAAQTKIWKTINGGTAWTEITGTLPVSSGNITNVAVKNNDPNTLWVTIGAYSAATVYQSVNAGLAWTNISTGLPQLPAYTVVQNKQITAEVQLYVGTELGVYFKKGANNWVAFNTGLPNVKIGELEIYYATSGVNSKLRAATYGRGLWETFVYFSTCTPPAIPIIGTITQPTCALATGSVVLSGLPSGGTWTLTKLPAGTNTTGTGTTTTITGLAAGTYTYTVTDSALCTSSTTANIIINAQPLPAAPTLGSLTQPTCVLATGSVVLNGLPATGTWTLTRTPGGIITTGTGASTSISGLAAGSYTFTVTNDVPCTSVASAAVVINTQPATPATPVISASGLVLSSNAASGNQWYSQSGALGGVTNQNYTITVNGSYYVIVTLNGCSSSPSNTIVITNVDVQTIDDNKSIKIYPNPVSNELTIEMQGNGDKTAFEIYNSTGQLVLRDNIIGKKVISTLNYPLGVYVIKLENGKTCEFKKLVKE